MYTHSAEQLWKKITEHVSDNEYSIKQTVLGLDSFIKTFQISKRNQAKSREVQNALMQLQLFSFQIIHDCPKSSLWMPSSPIWLPFIQPLAWEASSPKTTNKRPAATAQMDQIIPMAPSPISRYHRLRIPRTCPL